MTLLNDLHDAERELRGFYSRVCGLDMPFLNEPRLHRCLDIDTLLNLRYGPDFTDHDASLVYRTFDTTKDPFSLLFGPIPASFSEPFVALGERRTEIVRDIDRQVEDYRRQLIRARYEEIRDLDLRMLDMSQKELDAWREAHAEIKARIDSLRIIVETKMIEQTSEILSATGYDGNVCIGRDAIPGVYFLYSGDVDLQYIGQSKNIKGRLNLSHQAYTGHEAIAHVRIEDETTRLHVEYDAIAYASPPLNKFVPGAIQRRLDC